LLLWQKGKNSGLGSVFTTSELLDLVENVGSINDLSGKARLFLVLPVAIVDAFIVIWIFTSLSKNSGETSGKEVAC